MESCAQLPAATASNVHSPLRSSESGLPASKPLTSCVRRSDGVRVPTSAYPRHCGEPRWPCRVCTSSTPFAAPGPYRTLCAGDNTSMDSMSSGLISSSRSVPPSRPDAASSRIPSRITRGRRSSNIVCGPRKRKRPVSPSGPAAGEARKPTRSPRTTNRSEKRAPVRYWSWSSLDGGAAARGGAVSADVESPGCCARTATGINAATRRGTAKRIAVLQTVVRRFSRDDDIVRMRFTQPRSRDPNELCFGPERSDVTYPAIPHSAPQPANQLIDDVGDRAAVGDAPFDSLGDELLQGDFAFLEIAVRRALFHGRQAAHPADDLEPPPFEQERLARALLGPGQHRP